MSKKSFLNNEYLVLFLAALLNFFLLSYSASTLSVSYDEALIVFGQSSFLREFGFLHELVKLFKMAFGAVLGDDLAVRAPFLLTHFINTFLIYKISKHILPSRTQRLIAACLYMYLPGVLASAIIINSAVFIILISLISIELVYSKKPVWLFILLVLSIFISQAFMALYLALFFYGLYVKERKYTIFGAIFAFLWIFIFDFDLSGKPKSFVTDTMAVFGAAFSPLIFIYFVYAFYRIWVKESKDFLWFIAAGAFCFCLAFSIRAKPPLELFLPFCVIFVPHMVRLFFNAYLVRLPIFRLKYKLLAVLLLSSLALNSVASIFSDFLYAYLNEPKKHFAYPYAVAKELANELKNRGISQINGDYKMLKRLEFYGIYYGGELFLSQSPCGEKIEIRKMDKTLAVFYICK